MAKICWYHISLLLLGCVHHSVVATRQDPTNHDELVIAEDAASLVEEDGAALAANSQLAQGGESSTLLLGVNGSGTKAGEQDASLSEAHGLLDAFFTSTAMILVTEIGDETFIIAALMAMRHSRGVVLAGALSALVIMTVLSTLLGFVLPNVISKKNTNRAATVLYTFFGLRLLYIAWTAKSGPNQEEVEEVEDKLEGAERTKGRVLRSLRHICTPVFIESFILTFLAEWGDRSQIATIALASHKNPFGVTTGAIFGHTMCTSLAVVGGRLLAVKISQRTVAVIGGCLFLGFALHSYFVPPLT